MAFRHRLLQPRFIAVAICWLLATLYVVVRKTGVDRMASSIGESGDVRRDSRASRRTSRLDARAIAAMGRAGNEKCAWCKIVKAAGVHDSSREIVESAQSDYDPDVWLKRLTPGVPRLAIIVPYRNREKNLQSFLRYMVPFLDRQAKSGRFTYWIFVMEQSRAGRFNRGKLCNAGFNITQNDFDYFIFHDVDKLPEIKENSYAFPNSTARNGDKKCGAYHIASRLQQFCYRFMEDRFVGGVVMFTRRQYVTIGGMPNFYWGWGGEDDETYDRIKKRGAEAPDICRHRDEENIQRYSSLEHDHSGKNCDAVPNLAGDDRRRYECHYRMMKDYQENKRDTDRYTDAKYRTMLVVDQTDNRASIITVDLCWGNFKSSCNRIAKDVGCNLDRRFG